MQPTRAPRYFSDFQCIQDRCEDHCCFGWRVAVNLETFEKYQAVKTPVNGSPPSDHLVRMPEAQRTQESFGYIKMRPTNRLCPFFTEGGLCAVHRDLGPEFLSKTCAAYPRQHRVSFGRHELSLSLSCPEAARLALLNPDPMQFEEISLPEMPPAEATDTEPNPFAGLGIFFESVQLNIIRLLQRRSLSIPERMIVFGMFMKELSDVLQQGQATDIPRLVGKYGNRLVESEIKRQVSAIQVDFRLPIAISLELVAVSKMEGFPLARFHRVVETLAAQLGIEKDASIEGALSRYKEIKAKFQEKIDRDLSYILENYLVHRVFQGAMPFTALGSPFESYIQIMILLTVVRLLALGSAAADGHLSPEKLAEIIQLVTKVLEHTPTCLRSIHVFFEENGLNSLAHSAALLLA